MMFPKVIFAAIFVFLLTPFGSPSVALALGLAVALTLGNPFPRLSGKPAKYLLQVSIVLLGFGMDLGSVYQAGKDAIVFIVATIFGTLLAGYFVGKLLKVSGKTSTLISTGTAICGGSAIAAVGPTIKAENDEMSVSLGTVFVLNSISLFLFPVVGLLIGLSQSQFGMWAALAIHDTGTVIGAGAAYGQEALGVATTVKLARALWIAPVVLMFAFIYRESGTKAKIAIPWFVLLFIAAVAFRSYAPTWIYPSMFDSLVLLARAGLTITLFLIGLSLTRTMLKAVGWRPFGQGAILWIAISTISLLAVVYFV